MQRPPGASSPPAPSRPRVLVVGTTADYIDWIRRECPGEALFLTDPEVRRRAVESCPAPADELLCDLTDFQDVCASLDRHLSRYGLKPAGIACFDCESMELAARLAGRFALPYPSVSAVGNCRDKLRTKSVWKANGLDTPPGAAVGTAEEAVHFFRQSGGAIVLKPPTGSGSELVYQCADENACERAHRQIREGLQKRRTQRLYADPTAGERCILAEAMIDGQEFSCDFLLQDGRVRLIRLTGKIKDRRHPFGTIAGYLLPARLPAAVDPDVFHRTLLQSATALGIQRAICMLDFMVAGDRIILLELAPRPGGDCLPFMLRRQSGLDILKLQLDFARPDYIPIDFSPNGAPLAAVRLFASRSGRLARVDARVLATDPRVQEIHLIREPGHRIVLPPEDYESWLLGHILFVPEGPMDVASQAAAMLDRVRVEMA